MRPNIVYIVVDSLRADHLGCYGYGKNTSPNIDALAREGVVFNNLFAPGIPTTPSFTTLLTGLHPLRHGIVQHAGDARLAREIQTLPQLLQRSGYTTIGIDNLVAQSSGRGSWFARGFDFYSGFLYEPFSTQTASLIERAQRFLDDFSHSPFFLYLHLWDPHSPYGPPAPFDTMHYQPQGDEPTMQDVIARAPEYYQAFLDDMKLKVPDDYAYIVAQYDGEISYVDAQIGRLFAHLKALGAWEDTLVVVQSDHGECFGEGGIYFDHHGLYDAVTRVACVARAPQNLSGRCDALLSTEDIVPTIGELCGLEMPTYPLTGTSFARVFEGKETIGRDEIVCVEATRQASICLRTKKWKFIQPIAFDEHGETLPDVLGKVRPNSGVLFDLENDPQETRDASAAFPEVRADLEQRLQTLRETEIARHGSDLLRQGLSLPFDDFMTRLTSRKLRG